MPEAGRKRKKKEGRNMSGVSRYAAALHFLTVIPRTALLPLSRSPTGNAARKLAPIPFVKSSITAYED
jgi:hypothetical protein